MTRTIVFMMRRVHLSNIDLEMIERACRAEANRYRKDAERQPNPSVGDSALSTAEKYDRLAERKERFKTTIP